MKARYEDKKMLKIKRKMQENKKGYSENSDFETAFSGFMYFVITLLPKYRWFPKVQQNCDISLLLLLPRFERLRRRRKLELPHHE